MIKKFVQVLLTVFSIIVVLCTYYGFLPQGATVTKEYYLRLLRRLCETVGRKQPYLCKENSWKLHHDNGPVNTSLLILEFQAKNRTVMIAQCPICQIWSHVTCIPAQRRKKR